MLKAILSYSKKVPVPGKPYSSESYHLSLETELPEGLGSEKIQEKLHSTYELVKASVEQELSAGATPKAAVAPTPVATPPASTGAATSSTKASNKQTKYIMDLARERDITLASLNAEVRRLYRVDSVYDLSKADASKLVESLKQEARKVA